jgi:hypothetical protein
MRILEGALLGAVPLRMWSCEDRADVVVRVETRRRWMK